MSISLDITAVIPYISPAELSKPEQRMMSHLWLALAALSIASFLPASMVWGSRHELYLNLLWRFGCACCSLVKSRRSVFIGSLAVYMHMGWQIVDDNRLPQRR
jgi:hypothetical protein